MLDKEATELALDSFMKDVIKFAKINLGDRSRRRKSKLTGKTRRGKIDSSGKLRKSWDYEVKVNKNSIESSITALDYADDVDTGEPRKTRLGDINRWMKQKPIRFRDKNGRLLKNTPARRKSFREFIKWKVQRIGSDRTDYLKDAIEDAANKHESQLTEALFKDVEQTIEFTLKQLNK